ncbi:hypothetical protein GWI33_008104 [Rhynchophorus ferrugineus]|uniref:Uncharacterized protein n=1 Tax=Rhynchophorus ferrugineus TaxID=354439 RepID=A0A834MHN1_RHYFE|nr:hypothetical protein GWI33_008104 [Rhynchophorus ferrugineus]
MNSKDGECTGLVSCIWVTRKEGYGAFFKGLVPSGARILPTTILVFLFFEQLRLNFGYLPPEAKKKV